MNKSDISRIPKHWTDLLNKSKNEKRDVVIHARVTNTVSYLIGQMARRLDTTNSDMVFRILCTGLPKYEITDIEKEAIEITTRTKEGEIAGTKGRAIDKLAWYVTNLRKKCKVLQDMGYSQKVIEMRIEEGKKEILIRGKDEKIPVKETIVMIEKLKEEFK